MLVAQAVRASEHFCGTKLDYGVIPEIVNKIRAELLNLILVGMPGCGKSTVGNLIAEALGRKFIDADDALTEHIGRTPADIINSDGEAEFRRIESETLADLCKQSSLVIATGGGAVTINENYNIIRQNAIVIWLERDLERLPTKNRPISQNNSLAALYEKRAPMYERFSDKKQKSTEIPALTAEKIIGLFKSVIYGEEKEI